MGLLKKIGNGVGTIIGFKAIKSGYHLISDSWNDMTKRAAKDYISRNETFNEAMAREGTTEKELSKIYNNYLIIWWLVALTNIIATFYFFLYIQNGSIGAYAMIGYMSFNTAIMIEKSFRLYQIKQRRLCSFQEWVGSTLPYSSINSPINNNEGKIKITNNRMQS